MTEKVTMHMFNPNMTNTIGGSINNPDGGLNNPGGNINNPWAVLIIFMVVCCIRASRKDRGYSE